MLHKIRLKDLPERYAFTDPSGGKSRLQKTLAKSAIVVCGVDKVGHIFVLKAWGDRCSTNRYVEELYRTNEEWHPQIFGVEANAMQALFADMLRRESKALQVRIPWREVPQSTKVDKDFRVRTVLQPKIAGGELLVEENQVELVNQIATFPQCESKDVIDALASCVKLIPPRRTHRANDLERKAKIKYLRETGAPEYYIRQVALGEG